VSPGRGSTAERKFLALPYYSHRAVFAYPLSAFSYVLVSVVKGKSSSVLAMKRTGERKRFGKGFMTSHEFPNEQTKESFLIEIGELTKRLER